MKTAKRFAAVMMVLYLCLCCAAQAADFDPVIVRVGEISYKLSEVQAYWNNMAQVLAATGVEIKPSEIKEYEQNVVDSYVDMGIIENKFREFGLEEKITDRELNARTDKFYESAVDTYRKQIASQYGISEEDAAEYAQMFMKLNGFTHYNARQQAETELHQDKLMEYLTLDVVKVTEEEALEYYETQMVQPSREAYDNNIESFEMNVLYLGGETVYMPADYRGVRHIYLNASEANRIRLKEVAGEIENTEAELEKAQNKVYGSKVIGKDASEAEAEVAAAEEKLEKLQTEKVELHDAALEDNAETLAEIRKRLDEGEAFEDLVDEFNEDDEQTDAGYLVCRNSILWDETFRDAAMSLKQIGDVSEPVCTEGGVHILCYVADYPKGALPFEGELKESVMEVLDSNKRYSILKGFVEAWKAEYEIETHPVLLETPEILQG